MHKLNINITATTNNTIITVTLPSHLTYPDHRSGEVMGGLDLGITLFWASAGSLGFKGFRRSSVFAAESTGFYVGNLIRTKYLSIISRPFININLNGDKSIESLNTILHTYNVQDSGNLGVLIRIKGLGPGRLASIKGLKKSGINIINIKDVTPIPHNGCRPPKKRRL